MNKRGFTLVEIAIAAVVFSVSIASVFASVSSFRTPVMTATRKIKAGQLSKKILDGLRQRVSNVMAADTLQIGDHGTAGAPKTDVDFPGYQYWYTVSNVGGSTAVRVDLTVRTP